MNGINIFLQIIPISKGVGNELKSLYVFKKYSLQNINIDELMDLYDTFIKEYNYCILVNSAFLQALSLLI